MPFLLAFALALCLPGSLFASEESCPALTPAEARTVESLRYQAGPGAAARLSQLRALVRDRHCLAEQSRALVRKTLLGYPSALLLGGYVLGTDGKYDGGYYDLLKEKHLTEATAPVIRYLDGELASHLEGNFWAIRDHVDLVGELGRPEAGPWLLGLVARLSKSADFTKVGPATIVLTAALGALGKAHVKKGYPVAVSLCERILDKGAQGLHRDCLLAEARFGGYRILDVFFRLLDADRIQTAHEHFFPAFALEPAYYGAYHCKGSITYEGDARRLVPKWRAWFKAHRHRIAWDGKLGCFIDPADRAKITAYLAKCA